MRPAFASDDPPIRVAQLNYVEGDGSFQPGSEPDWGWATLNRPMTTGDSLWTGDRSRAEMHFGSTAIRVDGQTFMSFLNLDDRTVQIQLNSGTIDVRVRTLYGDDVFEVDTPNLAFTMLQPGDYRITVDRGRSPAGTRSRRARLRQPIGPPSRTPDRSASQRTCKPRS